MLQQVVAHAVAREAASGLKWGAATETVDGLADCLRLRVCLDWFLLPKLISLLKGRCSDPEP